MAWVAVPDGFPRNRRWEQWTDPALQRMAAVTRKYHYDCGYFDQHWAKVRLDASVPL
ncbi:hypothetical protein [Streptomyces mirabilis]|uniref:hypothetical protein n=1 Tax=Streptomyces mirabilis TaxID=68239 RepID=UPI0036B31721